MNEADASGEPPAFRTIVDLDAGEAFEPETYHLERAVSP